MGSGVGDLVGILGGFAGPALTARLRVIEGSARGVTVEDSGALLKSANAGSEVLAAAATLKRVAGQVNVAIHALGILRCLPHVLEAGEEIEYVSLGAGNTGKRFDLETNRRIAEFKFIRWRGGAEVARQNAVFKDFVTLATQRTSKRRYLYLAGTEQAVRFFRGGRTLDSVLKNASQTLGRLFREQYGDLFNTVGEYYGVHGGEVEIVDVSPWVPELMVD